MAAGENVNWQSRLSDMLSAHSWPENFDNIVEKLSTGIPLSLDDGVGLFKSNDLETIGKIANLVKESRFSNKAFFNVNVHINQTNICTLACKFCAFRRGRRAKDAYQLEIDDYVEDLRKYSAHIDEVHSVGGLHPEWTVDHYSKLFTTVTVSYTHLRAHET